MKKITIVILMILLTLCAGAALAEKEAAELTADCTISLNGERNSKNVRDHRFTSYWATKNVKNPTVTISSPEPVYGLYLCFSSMPAYEVQVDRGNGWETYAEGNPEILHMFYEMDGATEIRIRATGDSRVSLGFNEIGIFGEGKAPEWVQRWEPVPEKTDLLFVVGCPDEELLYLGGAIPVYACEKQRSTAVACLSYGNPSRRSELLNSLWSMGFRFYPLIGPDKQLSKQQSKAATDFLTGAIQRCRPEVVVTLEGRRKQRPAQSGRLLLQERL